MKRAVIMITLAACLTIVLAGGVVRAQSTSPTEIDDEHQARIVANCVSAKQAIRQVQRYDAGLRVNHGQVYEALSARLMSRFNTRVDSNGFNTRSLRAVTEFFDKSLDEFRTAYQVYARSLSSALAVDCAKDPVVFYNAVSEAADARETVHTSVQKLNDTITEYRSAFDAFKTAFIERTAL